MSGRVASSTGIVIRLALVGTAGLAALLPLPSSLVEARYSRDLYLQIQHAVTPISNRVPFALADALILVGLAWLILVSVGVARGGVRGFLRRVAFGLLRLAGGAAVVYLVFLATWGLNYRRQPLSARLAFDASRATPISAARLATRITNRANELSRSLGDRTSSDWIELEALIGPSFDRVQRQLGVSTPAVPGIPKASLLSAYFERAGVDGMTDPFFLEVIPNRTLLPVERAAVIAHEWGHLAGYADESEAGLVGWLVCLQGPPAAEYSVHLQILWQLLAVTPPGERAALLGRLHDGPRRDLRAMAARAESVNRRVSRVGWQVYDRYLKANRVRGGVASYATTLTLLLGTTFSNGWVPVLAAGQAAEGR